MQKRLSIKARTAALRAAFEAQGAVPVEAAILQPAEILLDLYGEDIRARAYVTSDALRGEQMLRPDFTVPVVQMHMEHGAEPARYTYAGEVFRKQEFDASKPSEYLQVGYEIFDREAPAHAEAEVFATIHTQLADLPLRAATGDIGFLSAAVQGLKTTEARRNALLRHIWRPDRFRELLERFAGRREAHASRKALLENENPLDHGFPEIGLRSHYEVGARIAALHADADAAPISGHEVDLIEALLDVREALPYAQEHLRDLAVDLPAISETVFRLEDRIEALTRRGVDVAKLDFEASYGRSQMEYYDGFVFGFYAEQRPDLPPVATGGRYDALTRVLGQGREIPAVGGVIRPELLMMLEGGQ